MRIISLTLSGYRQFLDRTVLEMPAGLTGICGPNGVGKSKLIEAIGYALYGPNRRILPKGDTASDLPSKAAKISQRVELVLELWGQRYRIVRSPRETSLGFVGGIDALAETPTGVTNKVIELLHLSPDAFQRTFVARQREVAGLQALTPKERQRLVNRLIGISQVEEAIRLAQEVRITRDIAWQREVDRHILTSEQAAASLEERRAAYAVAREAVFSREQALKSARQQHAQALEAVGDLQARMDKVAALQRQRETLVRYQVTLEENRRTANQRAEQAAAYATELAQARRVLAETANAPAQLDRLVQLAEMNSLLEQQEHLQRELDHRVHPALRARTRLMHELEEDEAALSILFGEIEEWKRTYALARQAADQAQAEADRHEHRRLTALRLGRSGACETCGQVFGDQLEQALEHYANEAAAARHRAAEAERQANAAKTREEGARGRLRTREQERVQRRAELRDYETLPGEEAQILQTLEEISRQLALLPVDLLGQRYDRRLHEAAAAEVERRRQAEAGIARLTPLAAQEVAARAEEQAAEHALKELSRQQDEVEAEIGQLEFAPDVLAQANTELAEAQAALNEAEGLARESMAKAAATQGQVQAAEDDLRDALQREQRITAARRALLIAERTGELLEQLLAEITAEARPRLVEFMESWARALIGPRFRSIELTDDYRITADLGSGPHQIEHFSGGEQTLLAVMLRVAISLFCRERAGFDTGFLILDEVFGDQDGDHRVQLVQFLEEIKAHYHQILVVNHVEDVTNMLDSIIDVVPTGPNTSTAILRL